MSEHLLQIYQLVLHLVLLLGGGGGRVWIRRARHGRPRHALAAGVQNQLPWILDLVADAELALLFGLQGQVPVQYALGVGASCGGNLDVADPDLPVLRDGDSIRQGQGGLLRRQVLGRHYERDAHLAAFLVNQRALLAIQRSRKLDVIRNAQEEGEALALGDEFYVGHSKERAVLIEGDLAWKK